MDYATFVPPVPSTLQRLGNGSFGVAYGLDKHVCMKITADPLEAKIAARMVGHTFRRVWDVYFCRELTADECRSFRKEHEKFRDGARMWMVLGERLYPLGNKVKQKARHWLNPSAYAPLAAWMLEARTELQRVGLDHKDMHSGNMAQTSGGKGKGRPRVKFIDVRAFI